MSKHTPGKWLQSHREMPNDEDGMYAVIKTYREANAKLIAAAPDLLEACQNALNDIKKLNIQLISEGKHGYVLMENELNAAITKAVQP